VKEVLRAVENIDQCSTVYRLSLRRALLSDCLHYDQLATMIAEFDV